MKTKKVDYSKKFPDKKKDGKSILEKIQIVQLRILKIFDDICRKHRLNYFLICGTLLGAIRHKGFIPWDDDTDVIMPREDYEKLVKIIQKELPEDLFWQDIDTDNFPHFRTLAGKIRDEKSQIEKNDNYHTGIFLDIFVSEKVSVNPKIARSQKKYLNFLYHLDLLKNRNSFMQQMRVKKLLSKGIFFKLSLLLFAFLSEKFLKHFDMPTELRNRYYKKINKKDYIYSWYTGGRYLEMKKEDIFPLKKVSFEGSKFNSLNNHHKFLTDYYGDYMTLPPKHLRKPGHIIEEETII